MLNAPENHGTRLMYRERKCRCTECRAWAAASTRAYNARRKELTGESYWQSIKPASTRSHAANCEQCGKAILARSENPTCSECRSRSKRGIYIRAVDRLAIYARDDWSCGICSDPVDPSLSGHHQWGPTLDHIVPRSLGGSDDPENLRLAHRACNSRRGARVA